MSQFARMPYNELRKKGATWVGVALGSYFLGVSYAAYAGATGSTLALTNLLGESVAQVGEAGGYAQGSTLTLTGCVAYAGTSTSASPQNLSSSVVLVWVGDSGYASVVTGAAVVATSGTWAATVTVPTNLLSRCNIGLDVRDTGTSARVIYPLKWIEIWRPLQ